MLFRSNTSGDLLHHRPLPDGHMKVSVDIALDMDALLRLTRLYSNRLSKEYENGVSELQCITAIYELQVMANNAGI